uniref:uncharacterized protein LOC120344347 n=1 Tax=Styela clava TaxID=7725 RepID=UPI00193A359B|nr:uncharacterized protein LOC120344347 [Styela clava]
MVSAVSSESTVTSQYHDVINQCQKALRRGSPIHTIRRRLSIGIPKSAEEEKNADSTRITDNLIKFRVPTQKMKSPLRRTRSSICMETKLSEINGCVPPSNHNSNESANHKMASLMRRSSCNGNENKAIREIKTKESGNGRYTSLAKTLSSIANLSSRKESRIRRQTPFRASLPLNKSCVDCESNRNASFSDNLYSQSRKTMRGKLPTVNESRLHSQSAIISSPDSGIISSLSNESFDPKSLVSPTRYDALEDESILESDTSFNITMDANETDSFASFCETVGSTTDALTCQSEKLKHKRLSLDAGQIRRQSRELIKTTSRFRRIAKDQMKMWSQRRNTIESEDQTRRQQTNMLRVSASGRVSLRQKNINNAENRLSLFRNTAESLLTLMKQPEMLQAFRTFLKSEYSEENLDFWLECEEYRNMKANRRKKMAAKIYATYLDAKAPREINIDAGTRARTESHLENPRENTFEEAQKHIFDLMERDSFRRFITSDKHM